MHTADTRTCTRFFDSWGALWVTCSTDHHDAQAFGPAGAARRVTAAELEGLGLARAGMTAWAMARLAGVLAPAQDDTGFDTLTLTVEA
jgi:hypothetical protein